uniref:C-type lectin domain-containing protein n=1 Tax=Cyprinus carpio carpio TaxID=630221 RepID=A0A8C1C9G9_CYPCA
MYDIKPTNIYHNIIIIFLMFIYWIVSLVKKCTYGWTNFGVRCYKLFSQKVNWVTAEKCQSLDANLVSVHNKIEHDFLLSLLPSSDEGEWLWTDGTPFDYTHWAPGQPDNLQSENCGEFNYNNNRWNDANYHMQSSCSTVTLIVLHLRVLILSLQVLF